MAAARRTRMARKYSLSTIVSCSATSAGSKCSGLRGANLGFCNVRSPRSYNVCA